MLAYKKGSESLRGNLMMFTEIRWQQPEHPLTLKAIARCFAVGFLRLLFEVRIPWLPSLQAAN